MIEEPVAPIGLATHPVEEVSVPAPEAVGSAAPAPRKTRSRGGAKRGGAKKAASSNGAGAPKDAGAKKPQRPRARKAAAKEAAE
jgi:hypothetical protein